MEGSAARVARLPGTPHHYFDRHRIIFDDNSPYIELYPPERAIRPVTVRDGSTGETAMDRYAIEDRTISEAVSDGGVLVVAQWEAKEDQADKVAEILDRFLPQAQAEPGAKLFLISRAKDNPAQFLFYELFRDEAALKAHQESPHFKSYIAGQALPLLTRRERTQYALL
ncbi:antibiotic biosynthesis monooxygenase family protein [Bradyrhizobium sp. ARR65]|uniref:putative quinol monooxygenase n=1 Tax=Bradyrhizobium sp. ARR65 TaxID=1040989 RepID=UPI001FD90B8A|nr:antibiotic biosynthesis monooxygenase family protein [Bradyrhizobium sp. ARR65]